MGSPLAMRLLKPGPIGADNPTGPPSPAPGAYARGGRL